MCTSQTRMEGEYSDCPGPARVLIQIAYELHPEYECGVPCQRSKNDLPTIKKGSRPLLEELM